MIDDAIVFDRGVGLAAIDPDAAERPIMDAVTANDNASAAIELDVGRFANLVLERRGRIRVDLVELDHRVDRVVAIDTYPAVVVDNVPPDGPPAADPQAVGPGCLVAVVIDLVVLDDPAFAVDAVERRGNVAWPVARGAQA